MPFPGEGYYHDWEKLSAEDQAIVAAIFPEDHLKELQRLLTASEDASSSNKEDVGPIADEDVATFDLPEDHSIVQAFTSTDAPKHKELSEGLRLIAEGKVAVLCLAGGQGTRLGSDDPKGMFDIGLPSGKSLFQIHAERLWKVQELAAHYNNVQDSQRKSILWIVLTSPATHAKTVSFFAQKSNFGLDQNQILFIQQKELPALTEAGKVILQTRDRPAMAPNGNGGLYEALVESKALDKLEAEGILYIDTYCVDNALARIADPLFVGQVSLSHGDVGSKVIAKAYPTERVGVFGVQGGAVQVVEYSELDPALASAARPGTDRLYFNWANISSFLFSPTFIRKAHDDLRASGKYHIARKSIKSFDGPVQGIKLESFIFDSLFLASKLVLVEVKRDAHFAPVKNANGAKNDTPDTARQAVLALHRRWLGGAESNLKEFSDISPKISYCGEGLNEEVKQKLKGVAS